MPHGARRTQAALNLFLVVLLLLGGLAAPRVPVAADGNTNAVQFDGTNDLITFGRAIGPNGTATPTATPPTWNTIANSKLGGSSLNFNGSSQYVTFGNTSQLGLAQFTLEAWIYWTGGGTTTTTGGMTAIPILTKGRGESEGSNVDCNYFLGLSSGKLAADFEDMASGANHPVIGTTSITANVWTHVAATYDGTTWQLYVGGAPYASLAVGNFTPRYDSIQHAGLATALTSNGTAGGFFAGTIDEARVWNYARSATEIASAMNSEIESASGLVGRWGMNEGSGTLVADTASPTLGAKTFTLETWFMRTGAGATTGTGTGGLQTALPLVTKGRGENENSNVDMNYFLGLSTMADPGVTGGPINILGADFEECSTTQQAGCSGVTAGLNRPVYGRTPIRNNVWNHAAVTYDGRLWSLYLNGQLDNSLDLLSTIYPRWDSIQHAGLATAMTSNGTAAGFFAGGMDETRIWNRPLSQAEIQTNMSLEVAAGDGLLGRWGLNEGTGTVAVNSVSGAPNGTLTNGPTWAVPSPFTPPDALAFGGTTMTDAYVALGDPAALDLQAFTLETWFKREGNGVIANTGTGGIDAEPLITKGRGESEGATYNMNYFLGIRQSDKVLIADMEQFAACNGQAVGFNNPIIGVTPIIDNAWYHAAVTFDASQGWRLYLNGSLQAQNTNVPCLPSYDSIQQAALGSALDSTGAPQGYFYGALDEARIWNYARSEAEIQATINTNISVPTSGLVARWALDEAALRAVNGSADTTVNGTIVGNDFGWVNGAPFNITFTPPNAPSALTATLAPGSQIDLAWTDNATNESGFAIEYAIDPGSGCGTWSSLGTTGANVTTFRHWNTTVDTRYCYQVRASNPGGNSAWSSTASASTPESFSALSLGRSSAYVRMTTDQTAIQLKTFTVETWFRREGPGVSNTTGTGGVVNAIPLVAKGAAEAEGTTADENFLLVIDDATDVLAADFEECNPIDAECGTGGTAGLNHPILGVRTIALNTWYHAAVTFDGNKWQLFLNGSLESELVVGRLPRWDNSSPLGLGTSFRMDNGTAQGFFDGSLDEVRIWNYARTEAEIRTTMNAQIAAATTGLVARWSLDEATGTAVSGSAGTTINGSIYPQSTPTGWNWTADAPFNANGKPAAPIVVQPANGATGVENTWLGATVSDLDTPNLTVTFFGRPVCATPSFTLVALPDTQNYSATIPATFLAQTNWVVANRTARNVAFVTHLGDIVNDASVSGQWTNANAAMTVLDSPAIPYGLAVGNHDSNPASTPANTAEYNANFGEARFSGKIFYGGHYGTTDNDNSYQLFTAGGMDFVIIHLEWDDTPDVAVLTWANGVLTDNSARRAIVVTHDLLSGAETFSAQGQTIYDALKGNANLFLMLGGHADTEVTKTVSYNGHTVYALRSDYQSRANGGNGWLRLMEFQPGNDLIQIRTYSPTLGQWETDADSEFTRTYEMVGEPCAAYAQVGAPVQVASGATAMVDWTAIAANTQYEWYVTVFDGVNTVTGPTWSFTSGANPTMIELESFTARPSPGGIRLDWRVARETDTAGYRIWRSDSFAGDYVQVSVDLIVGHPGGLVPADYSWEDTGALEGQVYYYRLEERDTHGVGTFYGPVSARAGMPYRVYFPLAVN